MSPRPLLAITHLPDRQLGLVERVAAEREIPIERLHIDDGRAFPALDEISGIVTFGGTMSVLDRDEHPFLPDEIEFLRQALEGGVPILGLCLGAQLLAEASGGSVVRLDRRYVRWHRLVPLDGALGDPVFSLREPLGVVEWHLDAIVPSADATVVAETSGPGCSVFRVGRAAWGSQIHLELTPEVLESWLSDPEERIELASVGIDPDHFAAQGVRDLPLQMAGALPILDGFTRLAAAV